MNLMMLLEMAATTHGDRIAVQNGADRLTYAELFERAGAAARIVRDSSAQHVAVLDVSSLAIPVGLFASAWAGVPFVPLNYRLTDVEIEGLVDRITPALMLTDAKRAPSLAALDRVEVAEREAFLERAAQGERLDEWPMDPEDIAILLFTSGTTGAPKAAVLRQKHLVSYVLGSVEFASAAETDAALVCVPPYHIAGMAAVASSVYSGRRIVQLPRFDPHDWLRLVREESITNAFVVPTMLARIVEALEGEADAGVPSLRALSYGGGKMPLPIIEKAVRLFPEVDFTNAYGLTETSSTIAVFGPDDHREALAAPDEAGRRRLVSVGRPLPTLEVEIRGPEGQVLPAGERGEIYVRGEQVSGEYLGRGSQLEEGWFPTRDGGYLDDEGFLFLEGRVDDVIVRGGENMSPGEIEDVLHEHPEVADVAVVGIPDEEWGEAVAAVVVPTRGCHPKVEELQGFVKERLRSSRVPQRIEFRDELPYNETGKLLRRQVREDLAAS